MILDTHCHTVASGHAYSTVKEYADEACQKGLELIAITDHAPNMPGAAHEYHFGNIWTLSKVINGVEILPGVELNILDSYGAVDLDESYLKNLDIVIASLHIPCIKPSSEEANTNAVLNAMDNPYINILGHLGDPRYPIDIEKIVSKAKDTGIIIELNNASLVPGSYRAGSDEYITKMLGYCKDKSVHITIGSDAHYHSNIGEFALATKLLRKIDFPELLVLNTSKEMLKEKITTRRIKYGITR